MRATCPAHLIRLDLVLRLCQRIRPGPRLCVKVFRNKHWVLWGVVSPPPNPQAGGPPTFGCPRLLIQYILSYPPYLEAVTFVHNPRTRHTVVTVDPLNMDVTEKASLNKLQITEKVVPKVLSNHHYCKMKKLYIADMRKRATPVSARSKA
jgi:hypothetical protein